MEKITVTRALAQLKLLDKKIQKAINQSNFANYTIGGKLYLDEYTPDSDLQKVQDLIKYRSKLKSSIMKSNASTKITIPGLEEMTVIEAIEYKDSIRYKQQLLNKIKKDLDDVEYNVQSINEDVQHRLDQLIQVSFGKDIKVKGTEYESIAKPFLAKNEAKPVDSLKFYNIAKELESSIDTFLNEIDLTLSESNSTTFIEL